MSKLEIFENGSMFNIRTFNIDRYEYRSRLREG